MSKAHPKSRIVLADDEPNLRKVLGTILKREGYDVVETADGEAALNQLNSDVAVLITDLRMPKLGGMDLLRRVVVEYPDIPVVIITAHGSVDSAVEAVKLGAFDYVEKPFEQTQIRQVVAKAVRTHELARVTPHAQEGAGGQFGLIGESPALQQIFSLVQRVSDTPSTVLITGESGTGKELIARALHTHSSRKDKPFIRINCAAIPKTLIESELFGHEKGAFTGAVNAKPGRFELADGGTLFLDEIGEIPVEMQVKLLRVLQESEFERVGGIRTLSVDVRLIAATNRDLQREVAHGNFRDDLYYRLNVVPIHLPPLRERTGDIPLLVDYFIKKFNERLKKHITHMEPDALSQLTHHSWPGNIRELENVLERTVLFSNGPVLHTTDLPAELTGRPIENWRTDTPPTLVKPPAGALQPAGSLKELVRQQTELLEKELIQQALENTGGNVTQAAKKLKISRKSLQNKMKEFGLRDRESSA